MEFEWQLIQVDIESVKQQILLFLQQLTTQQQQRFIEMKRRSNNKIQEQNSEQKQLSRKYWSQEEDDKLIATVSKYGSNWKLIAEYVPGRNASQCAQRWKRIKPKENERNQKWSEEEDREVLRLTKIYQCNWKLIAKEIPNRTGRQIRERYVNHLDPHIIKTPWTKQEDKCIWEMYQRMGTRWSDMSKRIPGRPENMIKNRFYSYIRKQYGKVQNPYYVVPNKVRTLDEDILKQSQGMKKIKKFKKIQKSFKVEEDVKDQIKQSEISQVQPTQFSIYQLQPQLFQSSHSQFPPIVDHFSYLQDSLRSDSYRQYPEAVKQYQDFQKWLKESFKSSSQDGDCNNCLYKQFETPMMSFLYLDPNLIHSYQQQIVPVQKEEENEKPFSGLLGSDSVALPVQMRPDIFEELRKQQVEQQIMKQKQ